jgi:hypothetical protein
MDEKEKAALDALGRAAMLFFALDEVHPADKPEFVHHMHACQNIVLARCALRALRNADKQDPRDTANG